jgi:hypothetical protein
VVCPLRCHLTPLIGQGADSDSYGRSPAVARSACC